MTELPVPDYTGKVRDLYYISDSEMIIFASYLNHIITILQTKNINILMQNEKELQEELYSKTQQINQYKETIRSFVHHNKEKKIGIIFYKNRHFIFGNKDAIFIISPYHSNISLASSSLLAYATPLATATNPASNVSLTNKGSLASSSAETASTTN